MIKIRQQTPFVYVTYIMNILVRQNYMLQKPTVQPPLPTQNQHRHNALVGALALTAVSIGPASLPFNTCEVPPVIAVYQKPLDIKHQHRLSTEEIIFEKIINDPLKDTSKA